MLAETILHLLYILFFGREDVDDVVFAVETAGTDVKGKCRIIGSRGLKR